MLSRFFSHAGPRPGLWQACLLTLAAGFSGAGHAQSSCSSDGQPRPKALLERFISADCADCWAAATTARAGRGDLTLDWIVPHARGEEAPLSAAATRDAQARLNALGLSAPAGSRAERSVLAPGPAATLRVAHGLPVSGYVGASITFKPAPQAAAAGPWTAWLALVETVPAGTEGTPVPRNMIRNTIQPLWVLNSSLSKEERTVFREARSMDIPPGMNTARLKVIGWVQDAQGRVVAAAQSRCAQR